MNKSLNNMTDFEEYIRQGEPDKVEKSQIWQAAIGLQQVDGLTPSVYLIDSAKENIEGKITIDEVKSRIDTYYQTQKVSDYDDDRTEEADKVSARITDILSNKTFSFTPLEYINIHRKLFTGIYKFAGKIRDYNITKNEWVLNGKTVLYSDAEMISATLEYDFKQEKAFNYKNLSKPEIVEHISKFISELWQIHAFGEGNTRTTAVFAIEYLRSFGFKVDNAPFAKNSWYFRNALVRANFNDYQNKIYATQEYLIKFFENLLFGENNKLENRYLHIAFNPTDVQSANDGANGVEKTVEKPVEKTVEKILDIIKNNPKVTQKELSNLTHLSRRGVEWNIAQLKQKGILTRIGGDRGGHWKINFAVMQLASNQ
ncbi:MAG: Adenosine monophosphate-protein transferase VbhT [Candidatus Ordinivivax streblomastigis]|uniref:protein adenylyltransferase n=1 Tax=Candidatus Ordinivivax streblomastigis TaxID=2540710 RepID=A0A5M8P224_9BACT|nr:MAG: Adenosine monophosphate-protein transferase VbhT [Candidatus Ordinivivax streblomastigis]